MPSQHPSALVSRSVARPRSATAWTPRLGAWLEGATAHFRVWAPEAAIVELVLVDLEPVALTPDDERGYWSGTAEAGAGTRYFYRVDGRDLPDPASRFQPEGVHGPSELIDAAGFPWTDTGWTGVRLEGLVIYELHVGTFTPEGTYAGVQARLPELRRLGVTAIELMPLADFPGEHNWGYDGVDLFAPSRAYGRPDDLRALVDAAHARGIGVLLDVVYNHLGPEGAYLSAFAPQYFSSRHDSPWGKAVNLDEPGAEHVRAFFIENALHWLHEYHVDGFRLDATHALQDESPQHFLGELRARVGEASPDAILIAEDERKAPEIIRSASRDGWGLDAVWADDFHHHVRRLVAGDHEGYFARYSGTTRDLARTIERGFEFREHASGEPIVADDPVRDPLECFVVCIQNHDQVGNRARGDRLHHAIDLAAYRAASALLLCTPQTPLLFMGQEWAASAPFCYFTDHPEALGQLVTAGRRDEFKAFQAFADQRSRERIPDPQARTTFESSVLDWTERLREPHASVLRLYQALLRVRQTLLEPAPRREHVRARAADEGALVLERPTRDGGRAVVAVRLAGAGPVPIGEPGEGRCLDVDAVLTTEHPSFAQDPAPPEFTVDDGGRPTVVFARPGAFIGRCGPRR
jgi:maltooligosyltrehalose trehalohydrolase